MKTKILFQFNLWVSGKGDNCHDWSQKVTATDKIFISLLRDCNWLKKVVPLLNLPVENIKQANFGGGCGNMSFDCLVCSFKYTLFDKSISTICSLIVELHNTEAPTFALHQVKDPGQHFLEVVTYDLYWVLLNHKDFVQHYYSSAKETSQ